MREKWSPRIRTEHRRRRCYSFRRHVILFIIRNIDGYISLNEIEACLSTRHPPRRIHHRRQSKLQSDRMHANNRRYRGRVINKHDTEWTCYRGRVVEINFFTTLALRLHYPGVAPARLSLRRGLDWRNVPPVEQ